MSTAPQTKFYSVEEYLEMEEQSIEKHEYYAGEIFAMYGAGINHNRIVRNALIEIGQHLREKECEIFPSDLKIHIEEVSLFTYPDLSIICEGPHFYENRNDTITNPSVLIEVLSPSTKDYDRGEKFGFYRQIPSLQEYILISSQKMHLEKYVRQPQNKWLLTEYKGEDETITIETIHTETINWNNYHNNNRYSNTSKTTY